MEARGQLPRVGSFLTVDPGIEMRSDLYSKYFCLLSHPRALAGSFHSFLTYISLYISHKNHVIPI